MRQKNLKINQKFITLLKLCAGTRNRQISSFEVTLYQKAVEEFPIEQTNSVLLAFFESGEYPSINKLRKALSDDEITPESCSYEIIKAIRRFGIHACYETEVKHTLSLLAQRVIEACGPFCMLCEICTNQNESILRAQWRELAKTLKFNESRYNQLNEPKKALINA